jgi:hypothetical protein
MLWRVGETVMPFGGSDPKVFTFESLERSADELGQCGCWIKVKVLVKLCLAFGNLFLIYYEDVPQSIQLVIHKD